MTLDLDQQSEGASKTSKKSLTLLKSKIGRESHSVEPGSPLNNPTTQSGSGSGNGGWGAEDDNNCNNNQQALSSKAAKAWSLYMRNNNSIVSDYFGGQLLSTVECMTCGHISQTFDPFIDIAVEVPKSRDSHQKQGENNSSSFTLSLPATSTSRRPRRGGGGQPDPPPCGLQDCFEAFSANETLPVSGDSGYTCEKCKCKRECKKALSIFKCPEILVVQIKRFRYTSLSREKIGTKVSYPLDCLDLGPYMVSAARSENAALGYTYQLSGVVHHSGGLSGGHYIAHVNTSSASSQDSSRTGNKGKWVCFNDSRVTPVTDTRELIDSSAYVLFYKRRPQSETAAEAGSNVIQI
jgi:ubiquitin carboxyl-terminal hydrolase 2/21